MPRTQEPVPPGRPSRPRWVYGLGLVIVLVLLGAIIFAVAFRSEVYVAPENAAPPIVTPPTDPSDGVGGRP